MVSNLIIGSVRVKYVQIYSIVLSIDRISDAELRYKKSITGGENRKPLGFGRELHFKGPNPIAKAFRIWPGHLNAREKGIFWDHL